MPTLLHIDSSPLPGSVSRELTGEFARTWKAAHPGGEVIYRDLAAHPPTPIDDKWIAAAYTAPAERSAEQRAALALSDELIGELERADEYVIGVAMHNFSIPAVLKLWIDQIVRHGRTFAYGEKGPRGFLQNKKATIVVASGGVYAPGTPAAGLNFIGPYLKTIFEFVGITDVRFIAAEGTARMISGTIDRPTFLKPVVEQIRAAAA